MCFERLENFMISSVPMLRSIMENEDVDALILYMTTLVCGSVEGDNESAGLALVTRNQALLWTECGLFGIRSREFSDMWTVMDSRVSSLREWLVENLPSGSVVGFDPSFHSVETVWSWENSFAERALVSTNLGHDIGLNSRNLHPDITAQQNVVTQNQYMQRLRLVDLLESAYAIASSNPRDVSRLFAVRQSDITTFPINVVGVITLHGCTLYVPDVETVSDTLNEHLLNFNVEVRDRNDLLSDYQQMAFDETGQSRGLQFVGSLSVPYQVYRQDGSMD